MSAITRENLVPIITELNTKTPGEIESEMKAIAEFNPYWNMLGVKIKEFLRLEENAFDNQLFDHLFLVLSRLMVGDREYAASLLDRFVKVQQRNNELLDELKKAEDDEKAARFFDEMIHSSAESYFLDFAFVAAFQHTKRDKYRLMFFFALKMLVETLIETGD